MISQTVTNSFKTELLSGVHDFTSDVIKLALFTVDADLNETTAAYSTTNESSGDNYTAGGVTLSASLSTAGKYGSVYVELGDVTIASTNIVTRGGLIYNSSKADRSIIVLDFGITLTKSGTDLTLSFGSAIRDNSVLVIK